MKSIERSEWLQKYKPLMCGTSCMRFETHLYTHVDFIKAMPSNYVWTEMDDGNILPGRLIVNRQVYYLTLVPHKEDVYVQEDR